MSLSLSLSLSLSVWTRKPEGGFKLVEFGCGGMEVHFPNYFQHWHLFCCLNRFSACGLIKMRRRFVSKGLARERFFVLCVGARLQTNLTFFWSIFSFKLFFVCKISIFYVFFYFPKTAFHAHLSSTGRSSVEKSSLINRSFVGFVIGDDVASEITAWVWHFKIIS